MRRRTTTLTIVFLLAVVGQAAAPVGAEEKSHSVQGSPLDTILSTHLWTDVAPAKDFVQDARPNPNSLDYEPLLGTDPARPKPRDHANLEALKAELEGDRATNNRKLGGHGGPAARPVHSAPNRTGAQKSASAAQAAGAH